MARITVTTSQGTVIEVFREREDTVDEEDSALPEPPLQAVGPARDRESREWIFFASDVRDAVNRARLADAEEAKEVRTDTAQVEREKAAAQELIDLIDEVREGKGNA